MFPDVQPQVLRGERVQTYCQTPGVALRGEGESGHESGEAGAGWEYLRGVTGRGGDYTVELGFLYEQTNLLVNLICSFPQDY